MKNSHRDVNSFWNYMHVAISSFFLSSSKWTASWTDHCWLLFALYLTSRFIIHMEIKCVLCRYCCRHSFNETTFLWNKMFSFIHAPTEVDFDLRQLPNYDSTCTGLPNKQIFLPLFLHHPSNTKSTFAARALTFVYISWVIVNSTIKRCSRIDTLAYLFSFKEPAYFLYC